MSRFIRFLLILFLFSAFAIAADAQPGTGAPPSGSTTATPLDPAAVGLLVGAAALKLKQVFSDSKQKE